MKHKASVLKLILGFIKKKSIPADTSRQHGMANGRINQEQDDPGTRKTLGARGFRFGYLFAGQIDGGVRKWS